MIDRHYTNGTDTERREAYATVVRTSETIILTSRVRLVLPIDTTHGKLLDLATIASDEARSALYASIDDYTSSESRDE